MLENLLNVLFETLGQAREKDDFINTLSVFLSPKEKILIAKRVTIMFLLLKNIEQRTICDVMKVSLATVNKYALAVRKNPTIKTTYTRLLRNDQIAVAFLTLMDFLFPPGQYGANWQAGWERKKLLERAKTIGI